jgi:prepilin-type processing-associated H-X9-DG protein
MPGRDNSKNLTFVEVIILVFVCLFFLAVVPLAFQKARADASRVTCSSNLSEIGRAMLIYAGDYDKLPRAGGRNCIWGRMILNWKANNRFEAYGLSADGSGGQATITSSFYLLVKYAGLMPKTFICPGDEGATKFKPSDCGERDSDILKFWDFGDLPSGHCSYSYHMPYGLYALTTSSEPGMAVAADRNPWISSFEEAKAYNLLSSYNPEGSKKEIKKGNSVTHKEKGQNVLFLDGHVSFEKNPCCGIKGDNIYTYQDGGDIRRGGYPILSFSEPNDKLDSYLVNEPGEYKTITKKEIRNVNSTDLKETTIVATLDCPIPEHRNIIWCSTFQMAWDRLKNDIIGEPVKVPEAEELAERLNKAEVSKADLQEKSFYSTAGIVKDGIIEEIITEMKKRFPSEPKPDFSELNRLTPYQQQETIVTYSFLDVDVNFKKPFHNKESKFIFQDSSGKGIAVTSFFIDKDDWDREIAEQVEILYYKENEEPDKSNFVVDLCKYTSPYQIVLALLPRQNTLRDTVDAGEQKILEFKRDPDYEQLRKFQHTGFNFMREPDSLIVPDILYKLTHHYEELIDKKIKNPNYMNFWFLIARQMINFSLSRTGVTLKSEGIAGPPPPARLKFPRLLHFNKPFLIYVKKRQGGTDPFFVMWVDNAELMQEFESK